MPGSLNSKNNLIERYHRGLEATDNDNEPSSGMPYQESLGDESSIATPSSQPDGAHNSTTQSSHAAPTIQNTQNAQNAQNAQSALTAPSSRILSAGDTSKKGVVINAFPSKSVNEKPFPLEINTAHQDYDDGTKKTSSKGQFDGETEEQKFIGYFRSSGSPHVSTIEWCVRASIVSR